MRKIWALVHKEWSEVFKNKMVLFSVDFMPLIFCIIPLGILYSMQGVSASDVSGLEAELGAAFDQLRPLCGPLADLDCTQFVILQQFMVLFLMMPAIIPVTIASYSIVGEKNTRTLEPLLATPITTGQLLAGKALRPEYGRRGSETGWPSNRRQSICGMMMAAVTKDFSSSDNIISRTMAANKSSPMSKAWVSALRILWIALALTLICLSIFGWNLQYQTVLGSCSDPACFQVDLSETGFGILGLSLGLSPAVSAALDIALGVLAVLPYFVMGFILFSRHSSNRLIWLGAFMLPAFGGTAIASGIWPLIFVPTWLGTLAKTVSILGQITFLNFFLVFPNGRFVPRWTAVLAALWTGVFVFSVPFDYDPFDVVAELFIVIIATLMFSQMYRYRKVSSLEEKQQTKWVVIGLSVSLGGFLLSVLGIGIFYNDQPPPLVDGIVSLVTTVLFALIPIWIGIAITRYRLWDVEVVVNRALIYGPLSAILAGVFAASVALINLAARDFFGTESTATATVAAALFIATIFQPLRTRIETWVNKRFYPDNANLIKEFIEFSPEVRSVIKLKQLLEVVTRRASALLNVEHAAILLGSNAQFRRAASYPSAGKASAVIKPDKAVRAQLQKGQTVARGKNILWVPLYLQRVRSHDVLGVMVLGPRKNRAGYSSDDKKALSKLGAEIGVSIYTAQLRETKKR